MDGLFHSYACARGSVEQPLEVKARELVVGVRTDVRGKCCERARIICLQLGECCEIGLCGVAGPCIGGHRFDQRASVRPGL